MAGASDNGGWSSDGGSPDDLPDLPEEWGVIVIPDDLSELSDEVEAIRAELHLTDHRSRWARLIHGAGLRRIRRVTGSALRAPVLIISMAVLVTIASLFASAWPGPPRQPAAQRSAATTGGYRSNLLPALELIDARGNQVSINNQLPAVIMVIDGCDCAALVAATVALVKPEIAVVTVSAPSTASTRGVIPPTGAAPQAQGKTVRTLHDPTGTVRKDLRLGAPDGTAAVLLVNRGGEIVHRSVRTASVDDFGPHLARL